MGRLAVPTTAETDARQTESRLRELDRKSAGAAQSVSALLSSARHHWHGNGLVDAAVTQDLTTWTEDVNDGVATLTSGQLVLGTAGRWSLWFQFVSDATEAGNCAMWLEASSGPVAPWGPVTTQLRDERLRGSGYAQAGRLTQSVNWTGVVLSTMVSTPIRPRIMWRSATGSAQLTASWALTAHYLGAARLPS